MLAHFRGVSTGARSVPTPKVGGCRQQGTRLSAERSPEALARRKGWRVSDLFGNDPRYASPEALARIADAPLSVCRLLFAAAEDDIDTLRLLRSGALDEDSVRMRQAVAFVAKLSVNCSLPEIGRTLNMDHSAVQRSVDAALDRLALDPEFTALVRRLKGLKLGMGRHPGKDGPGQKDAA